MILEADPRKWFHHKQQKITTPEHAKQFGPVLGVIPNANLQPRRPVSSVLERSPVAAAGVLEVYAAGDHAPAIVISPQAQPQEKKMEQAAPVVSTPSERQFKSVMEHLLKYVTLGLEDVIRYAPPAEILAQALFPEYALAEKSAQIIAVQVATLLLKAVISSQQKYASAPKSRETNAAKLADVLSTVQQVAVSLLIEAGFSADAARVQYAIEAIVAILKTTLAPVSL